MNIQSDIKGIVRGGETLKQHRDKIMEATKSSGHYAGLRHMELRDDHPIKYNKLFSRLRAGVVDARETAKKIAASPIVEQEGELCFSLYNAAGDCILTSTGIIIHVGTMGAAIKYMIENGWESNPGIRDRDIFCNNDSLIGNVHPCDIHTIVPIFHEGELIGWVGGVTHVIDTGAVGPGSMTTGQVQRFGDGYSVTCRKIGENDTLFRDWLHESQRAVRTTRYWMLDERTRVAGCHMIRKLVEEVIADEGIESYWQFAYEAIEHGRLGLQNRIKAMTIPGTYRQVGFVDVPYSHEDVRVPSDFAKVDTIMHTPSEMTIRKDGTWRLDFEGSSRWGWHTYNAHSVSFTSGIWVMMTQSLIPSEMINDGAAYGTEFRLPKGTWMNPDDRRVAFAYSWHFLVSSWTALWRGLSRSYFGRGYLEEVNAGNANTSNWLQGGGFNQYDEIHAVNSFECAANGIGASAVRDGISHAAAIWNPEGDMGDMEIWELAEPLVYLGRQIKASSGGAGKYRGGCGFESLRMVWNAKDWTMFFMGNGHISSDWGLMGGYPAASGYRFAAHDTGLKEKIARGEPIPWGGDTDPENPVWDGMLEGARIKRDKQAITTEEMFDDYDLYLNYMRGGPGFGDPLDRKPEAVAADVNGGYLLARLAGDVYGVVLSEDARGQAVADLAATEARRAEIRQERLAQSVPTGEWMKAEREKILAKEAGTQVQQMFAASFKLGPKFERDFRAFWDLPESWQLKEADLPIPSYGKDYSMDLSELPDVTIVQLVEE
ncbi:hydantoinase B/oxoprolinase family protein [Rhodovulum sulfidophilum]|uniref:N-methyl hydantoinase n=1 Tax=Rhodovulum sulfidophilum TaxID=35806 RepID=A0A0D6B374_RHOSU|nr:hydantoinase B/oxoprolinase family protein [Rhodovulum sulfidophilum]ANB34498.1 acetone carboxylase subunit alpha [Rhodovulum sulfidophilum DSM 1374]ANB38320.1 acetone carboxylase subunit alpha [Rhodovulum sulfidophilum]MBL3551946.1 hydantoinase B/oxoprolinase family protein [Rhodovulum sulfidophilum]MBL3574375.1 hydantoinase B/oxoprolinase family protein [Rhodovulum sulfidophilum]MCE8432223.1 hydantoinase B/oxoprolinase family protein [Rhodovulum sulfidophilum]